MSVSKWYFYSNTRHVSDGLEWKNVNYRSQHGNPQPSYFRGYNPYIGGCFNHHFSIGFWVFSGQPPTQDAHQHQPRMRIPRPSLKLTASFSPGNGWLEYGVVSFWGKRPIFRCEVLVSGRVNTFNGAQKLASCVETCLSIQVLIFGKPKLCKFSKGGGNSKIFWHVHPENWGNDPIWRAYLIKSVGSTTFDVQISRRSSEVGHPQKSSDVSWSKCVFGC